MAPTPTAPKAKAVPTLPLPPNLFVPCLTCALLAILPGAVLIAGKLPKALPKEKF